LAQICTDLLQSRQHRRLAVKDIANSNKYSQSVTLKIRLSLSNIHWLYNVTEAG